MVWLSKATAGCTRPAHQGPDPGDEQGEEQAVGIRTQPEGELPAGTPLLLSNEMGPIQNLSFEREFGRLIGSLDLLAQIVADKSNRTVVKVVHNLATALFLPVK